MPKAQKVKRIMNILHASGNTAVKLSLARILGRYFWGGQMSTFLSRKLTQPNATQPKPT
jgi:hypothetical protein